MIDLDDLFEEQQQVTHFEMSKRIFFVLIAVNFIFLKSADHFEMVIRLLIVLNFVVKNFSTSTHVWHCKIFVKHFYANVDNLKVCFSFPNVKHRF